VFILAGAFMPAYFPMIFSPMERMRSLSATVAAQ